tara:strand:+ start:3857 stop:4168 length:312 start_codon:yes stop_codon:yes gene_type:complete
MNRYSNLPTLRDPETLKNRYINVKYPGIPISPLDIYTFVSQGDRYDTLALTYYKDSSLWWIISRANPSQPFNSLYPNVGSQIRIPASSNTTRIIAVYELMNGI